MAPTGEWDACYQLRAQLEPKTKLPEQEGILRPAAFNPLNPGPSLASGLLAAVQTADSPASVTT